MQVLRMYMLSRGDGKPGSRQDIRFNLKNEFIMYKKGSLIEGLPFFSILER
jgi:hypothetical protein